MDELGESRVEHLVFTLINTFVLNGASFKKIINYRMEILNEKECRASPSGASLINKIEGTPIHMINSELCIIYICMRV